MERTIKGLRKTKEKSEISNRTYSKLRTKQNTRLVQWNNMLKFENANQTVTLQKKKIEQKTLQDMLNDLKRRETKVRRQYNEMMQKAGSSSRASSAVNRDSQAALNDNGARARSGVRVTSANKLNAAADA